MKRNSLVVAAIVGAVLVIILAGRVLRKGGGSSVGDLRGKPAPEFELKTLDGKTTKLADYRGKAVFINFWATWCGPCRIEMPWIVDLQKRYADQGLQVIGISMDESTDDINKFQKETPLNYPVVLGTEAVADAYGGFNFLPMSYFVDRDGKVTGRVLGLKSRSELEDNVKVALGGAHAAK